MKDKWVPKVGEKVRRPFVSSTDADLMKLNWYLRPCATGPSYWKQTRSNPKREIYLHREVAERVYGKIPNGLVVDHIDGNQDNNKRSNLRLATKSLNALNGGPHFDNKSGYRGVRWHPKTKKWNARICVNGLSRSLGYYDSPGAASRAYEAARSEFIEVVRKREG